MDNSCSGNDHMNMFPPTSENSRRNKESIDHKQQFEGGENNNFLSVTSMVQQSILRNGFNNYESSSSDEELSRTTIKEENNFHQDGIKVLTRRISMMINEQNNSVNW